MTFLNIYDVLDKEELKGLETKGIKRLKKEIKNNREYNLIFISVLNSNLNKRSFVKLAKTLFESEDIKWEAGYGGKSWGKYVMAG